MSEKECETGDLKTEAGPAFGSSKEGVVKCWGDVGAWRQNGEMNEVDVGGRGGKESESEEMRDEERQAR
eukprot:749905-Hanusia_phi.AAC.1